MKALVYDYSIPKYLLSGLCSKIQRRRFHHLVSPLGLRDVSFKSPAPGWVVVKPLLCGVCGSDLGLLRGAESLLLEPYASLPAILGHEIVGRVDAADAGFAEGERVLIEPVLSCEPRGLAPCRYCASGRYNLCENFLDEGLAPGSFLGFNRDAGGGMAEMTAAHPSRLLRVPERVSDEDAVLVDSMASVLAPILRHYPGDADTVAIYGAGVLGQHGIRLLRALGSKAKIVVVARHGVQAELAAAGGADVVLRSPSRKELAGAVGGKFVKTSLGGGNIEGGADIFFDCAGGSKAFQEGLLALRGRGAYVMVATTSQIEKADVSSLWFREITVTGSSSYATAPWRGATVRVYRMALDILAGGGYPSSGLLTHLFRLEDYRRAFQAAIDKKTSGSLKVAFDMR
ncbi:MAG: alcohol dehydrogenase catalytic domain-containing protein [Desulfovibrionaceae bacterium]|nr:alcohol dehydrogenase catalytic domain-containing protein [Desulfovibrionaceae bacterium]MBF0513355.1 alcohol dehydrogenase catalytic domain-containing protein [Desulfovibrionaceae bacterium]